MNWDRIEGNWKQVTGKVKEQWGKLTDDDITVIGGKQDQLVGPHPGALRHRQGRGRAPGEHLDRPHVVTGSPGPVPGGDSAGNHSASRRWIRPVISSQPAAIEENMAWDARALLWLLGVPIPVLLLMWALGWLH